MAASSLIFTSKRVREWILWNSNLLTLIFSWIALYFFMKKGLLLNVASTVLAQCNFFPKLLKRLKKIIRYISHHHYAPMPGHQSVGVRACESAIAHVRAVIQVRKGCEASWNCACEVRACGGIYGVQSQVRLHFKFYQ